MTSDDTAWSSAYFEKNAAQELGAIILCVFGIGLLAVIGREPFPRYVGMASMFGIAIMLAITRGRRTYAPWIVASVLSVGPAYSFGLHSGIAAVMVPLLFVGGLFRGHGAGATDRRGLVLFGICASHLLWFVLIVAGVMPDTGNVQVLVPGHSAAEPYILHAVQTGVYIAAFVAGQAVDRRLQAAVDDARAATADAARHDAALAAARGDLDRLLHGDGIFTGSTIGPYRVGALLGRGGMGEVYDATTDDNATRVALKLVRPDHVTDRAAIDRFAGEARVLTRVKSDHVARVLAAGGVGDGLPFIAMEYVGGESLATRLRARGTIGARELAGMVDDIAAGLRDVHAAGIVHLDVKPSNIIYTGTRWVLVDFGVARLLAGPSSVVEQHGGTPQYMAPEQAAGERVDTRTDLYALALVIYRALAGRPAATSGDLYIPETLAEDVVAFLRRGLALDPADRFASAAEMANAFRDCSG
jgi:serine/threonine-protein kinase